MGEIERLVPSGIIERWVVHMRRQRARALDSIWLIENGFTIHDGRGGVPLNDATARVLAEQQAIVDEVSTLLELYDSINLRLPADDEPMVVPD